MVLSVKELREKAKEKGLKGYSGLSRANLERLLAGEKPIKTLNKNQVSKAVQSEFPLCQNCELKQVTDFMIMGSTVNRDIVYDGVSQYDAKTGELLGVEVAYVKHFY